MGPRVVVIGGGIGGLTAAVAFARRGIRAEIYEQAPELREVGAGVGLWPNTFRALAPLGLAEQLRLTPRPKGFGFRRTDGKWLLYQPMDVARKALGNKLCFRAPSRAPTAIGQPGRPCGAPPRPSLLRFRPGKRAHPRAFRRRRRGRSRSARRRGRCALGGAQPTTGPARLSYHGYRVARGLTEAGSVPLPADAWETWGHGARFGLRPP